MSVLRSALILLISALAIGCGGDFTATSEAYDTDQNQPVAIELKSKGATAEVTYRVDPNDKLTGVPPNLVYTPANGFYGVDRFNFTAETMLDGNLTSATGTITVNVHQITGADEQVTSTIKNVKVGNNFAVFTLEDAFSSNCNVNNQVVVDLSEDASIFNAGLNSLVIDKGVTIFLDGCIDVEGNSISRARELLAGIS